MKHYHAITSLAEWSQGHVAAGQLFFSLFLVISFVPGCEWTEEGTSPVFEPGAVSHLVTWQDGRCSSGFLASLPQPESHLSVASGFGCATIFWLLKNRYGQLIFESGAVFPGKREWLGGCTSSWSASPHLLEHPSVRWPGTGCGHKT